MKPRRASSSRTGRSFFGILYVIAFFTLFSGCSILHDPGLDTALIETHTVSYYGNGNNGGNVPIDTTRYRLGQTLTILGNSNGLNRNSYSFTGWNTENDGSGTGYSPGQNITVGSADILLYARWTSNPTYRVYYSGNGNTSGTAPTDSTSYEAGQSVIVLGNSGLNRTGYGFTGWNTASDGSGISYSPGQIIVMGSANIQLYALWTSNPTYRVYYYGNGNTGGTAPVDNNRYESGRNVIAGSNGSLYHTGFRFTGWNTASDGSGTSYSAGQIFTMGSSDVNLYACWAEIHRVYYNGNNYSGGQPPGDINNYIPGQTVVVLGNTLNLIRAGYRFTGWNTASNGSGITYSPGQSFTMESSDVTLFALWALYGAQDFGVQTIVCLSDGRILIGGPFTSYNGTTRNRIARLNSNGTLDGSFNTGTGASSSVMAIVVQNDGNILIGGYFSSYNGTARNYIARLNSNGSLDTTLNPGTGADNTIYALAVQNNDGRILIGGGFYEYNGEQQINRIARLNFDGSRDRTFDIGIGTDNSVNSIVLQSDGRVLIGGGFSDYDETPMYRIARLNTNGSLDGTFTPGAGANNVIQSIVLQSDNRILVGGNFTTYDGAARNYIARLNANGTLDGTFTSGTGANNYVYAIAVQNDGRILIGGDFTYYNGTASGHIARLNADGSIDGTFTPGTGANNTINAIAVQSDGRILIGGNYFYSYNGFVCGNITRLNTDGTFDATFNP
jgi:uncharacterized delta-60 repeat protein/uncharacterized repeat protein (TIGR02543 family)